MQNFYLPFYRRKWKRSSMMTNEDRRAHLFPIYAERTLGDFGWDEFQTHLDEKAVSGRSYSVVAHLRWGLRQIFRIVAVMEGHILRNPAELLFVPRDARRPEHTAMNREEVQTCFAALEQRERLIVKFAVLAGLRPGEIFGLKWGHISELRRAREVDHLR